MKQLTFENTILSIHKDIQVKLKKTNETIDRYIKSEISIIPKLSKYFFNKRGKQLRPVLCLLSSKMINSNYSQINTDISMAAALEFIHGATLLHDDVIDKGKIRRGQRSINDIWNNKFSVLLGDFMFSKSFQLMTKGNSLSAMESLAEVSSKISEGEFLQLSNEQNMNIKIEEYINIISLKTAEFETHTKTKLTKHNIPEPIDPVWTNNDAIDLVITPLLAFDLKGYRVGYGKGFYDRFFASLPKDTKKVGISLFEPCEAIEDVNEQDIPLTHCVTPNKVFTF